MEDCDICGEELSEELLKVMEEIESIEPCFCVIANMILEHQKRYGAIRERLARAQLEFGDNVRIQEAYELCNQGLGASTK